MVVILRGNFIREEPRSVNRPVQVKPDNFFLLLFNALRQRRVPLALRIASHSLLLVALALVIYAWVMGMQFKQAMQQQADAVGRSLIVQTATSATELLVSNDILSLNVLLSNLAKNPLRPSSNCAVWSCRSRIHFPGSALMPLYSSIWPSIRPPRAMAPVEPKPLPRPRTSFTFSIGSSTMVPTLRR